jgi:arylsulfatase A-like enzyme
MRRALPAVFLFTAIACGPKPFGGPLHLLTLRDASGAMPRAGALSAAGETRPSLLTSARYRVPLPGRGLLTFGIGLSWAGQGEAPGWYRLAVRADGRVLAEKSLNPRAAHGFRDVAVPLEGLSRETTVEFDLRLTDRDGRPVTAPPDLLLGVADPVVHDLDAYGRAKGIVLVSIDTLRRDHVGAYGYQPSTTPRLDALAREGILFDDAVSTASWTLPAHLSMLTSSDPALHGGVDLRHGFNHQLPTLPGVLRQAGFATHAVTSHLYVSPVYGLDDGFDHMDFHQDRKAADVADRAIEILDRVGDRPFFLFLHFYDPHWHYDPPDDRLRLFETEYTGQVTGLWQDFSRRNMRKFTSKDLDHIRALYDGEIRYVDDELGRVLDHMKTRGLERGTLLVLTSDHGEEFLDHGSWEHQKTLYEEVVRIPLVVHGPKVEARREPAQVSLRDVAPTVLAWADVAQPAPWQGASLLAAPGDREAYGETNHTIDRSRKLFLRAGQRSWKTILTLSTDGSKVLKEEWYDLAADPREQQSTAPLAAVAEAIRSRALDRWRGDRGRGGAAPEVRLTPEQRERLKALGYVEP